MNFTSEVNHDFLEVRNGPQHSSSLIGQFSGTQLPPDLLSTTHEIVIHFYTDHSQNQQGFRLTYKGEAFPILPEYSFFHLHVQMYSMSYFLFVFILLFYSILGCVHLRRCCAMTTESEKENVQNESLSLI